jgi:hypothetical protein
VALLSAVSINDLSRRLTRQKILRLFLPLLSVVLIFIPIFYQAQIMKQYRTIDVLVGRTSRDDFLEQAIGDYAAARFIQAELPDSARVLMLGNGRGYYCVPKCIPDPDHFHWARQIVDLQSSTSLITWLRDMDVTHLLISIEDLDFLLQHDARGVMLKAFNSVSTISSHECFDQAYADRWTEIYSLKCVE